MDKPVVDVGKVRVGGRKLTLIAGPCVIESRDLCMSIAETVKMTCAKAGVQYIFKASYDKANRTSISSFRGPGIDEGLKILEEVRKSFGMPVISDVHKPEECKPAGQVLDALQIPAFLCRQTDLVVAAASTGKPLEIKKGQFMAPQDMKNVCEKASASGNNNIILTERGTFFGYHRLVNDMRSIPQMRELGCPVIFDGTHSVQEPGGHGNRSGGERGMVPTLSLAAIAAGADGLFLEVHPDPDNALSDAASMMQLTELADLLKKAVKVREAILQ